MIYQYFKFRCKGRNWQTGHCYFDVFLFLITVTAEPKPRRITKT